MCTAACGLFLDTISYELHRTNAAPCRLCQLATIGCVGLTHNALYSAASITLHRDDCQLIMAGKNSWPLLQRLPGVLQEYSLINTFLHAFPSVGQVHCSRHSMAALQPALS